MSLEVVSAVDPCSPEYQSRAQLQHKKCASFIDAVPNGDGQRSSRRSEQAVESSRCTQCTRFNRPDSCTSPTHQPLPGPQFPAVWARQMGIGSSFLLPPIATTPAISHTAESAGRLSSFHSHSPNRQRHHTRRCRISTPSLEPGQSAEPNLVLKSRVCQVPSRCAGPQAQNQRS